MTTGLDAARLERCRQIFKERVLPAFPGAEERFKKHFGVTCQFVRAMPLLGYYGQDTGLPSSFNLIGIMGGNENGRYVCGSSLAPVQDKESLRIDPPPRRLPGNGRSLQAAVLELEIAFTALGIKPMTVGPRPNSMDYLVRRYGNSFLPRLGLDIIDRWKSGMTVFDPVTVAPILSRMLNRYVSPENAKAALIEREEHFRPLTHDLLGYPEEMQDGKSRFEMSVHSRATLGGIEYRAAHFSCIVHTPELAIPHLDAFAAAAAVVEEIQDFWPTESVAWLMPMMGEGGHGESGAVHASVSIERSHWLPDWRDRKNQCFLEWFA